MEKVMSRIAFKLVLMTLAVSLGAPAVTWADQAGAAPPQTARAVMEKVIRNALLILRDQSLSADQKRVKVQQIAYDNMNFEVMGRLSLGRFYRNLTDAQRTQYQQEFKQLLTNTYGHTTDDYTDEDVKVTADRQESDGDFTVQTHITGTKDGKSGQDIATVDYRLRKQDNQWKVIDFTIDGVSIVSNYRSQFQDIMTNGGIDQLLKMLHDKNAANAK
jgi:phospholipid transport system substrate-binding protein